MFAVLLTFTYVLYVTLDQLLPKTHKVVAVSMVHSRLDYANSVVHRRTNIKRLQLLQNSVARAVLNNRPELSTSELLHSLHWLPVESRIVFNIAAITYKVYLPLVSPTT